MIKFLKISHKKTVENLRHNKENNALFKLECIIRGSKIKIRLMISYGLLVLIPLVILGISSVVQSKSAINNKISIFSSQMMSQIGANISNEMSKTSDFEISLVTEPDFQDYFQNKESVNSLGEYYKANLTKQIRSKVVTRNDMTGLGIVDTDNNKIGYFSNKLSDDLTKKILDLSNKEKGNFVWSLQKNSLGYSIYNSIQVNGKDSGVIVGELDPKLFVDLLKNVNLGTNSDIFVVDSNGIVILNEDSSLIGTEYKDKNIVEKIQDTEKQLEGLDNATKQMKQCFSTNNGEALVSYAPLSGSNWYVVGVIPYNYLNAESNILRNNTIILGLISFVLAMLVALIISRSISNPLGKLVLLMKKAKGGNLSLHIIDESKDEISEVISAFNDMVTKINILVSDVKISTESVYKSARVITEVSQHSSSASEEVTAIMSEIANGASSQAVSVNEGMRCMDRLSYGISEVSRRTEDASLVLEETKKMKKEAIISVETLNKKAEETNVVSDKIVREVNVLNSNIKDIKAIVELIGSIAEQTNLLALNAAIEAARAGDSGKGFAVVADEIRKLADRSKEASNKISGIITDIQDKAEIVVEEATSSSAIIKQQMDAVEKTDTAFKVIFEGTNQISNRLEEIIQSINEIVDSRDKTELAMKSISSISKETAATTEKVSAEAQEQIEGIQKVSEFAEELNAVVKKLNSAVNQFIVN